MKMRILKRGSVSRGFRNDLRMKGVGKSFIFMAYPI